MARMEESFTVFFSLLLREDTVHVRLTYVKCVSTERKTRDRHSRIQIYSTHFESYRTRYTTALDLRYTLFFFFLRSAYVYLRDLTTIDNARRQLRYTKIHTCLDLAQPLTATLQEHKRGEYETKRDRYSKKK